MIDHLSSYATNFVTTRDFYVAVFSVLEYDLQTEFDLKDDPDLPGRRICSFGERGKGIFWIIESIITYTPRHIAFTANSQFQVEEFYRIAMKNNAIDNGAPNLRPEYHAHYYGAFVLDPDGNNIEAVYHGN